MIDAIMVNTRVRKSCPWARLTSPAPILSPSPVRVTTPIIIPAIPQAIATDIMFLDAAHITSTISFTLFTAISFQ